ncbi:hypothetical protein KAR91_21570 [Candidatus Pacearchaeota archaeon]|nr:hypothetical protein [Candidatus Pacearchaeota archaeon]
MTKHEKKVCDKLWQIKVTGGTCSFPGCNRIGNEGHHVMKRRYLNTRWVIENGRRLCREHHLWADTHPAEYENMIIREIGSYEYENLRIQAQMVVKQFYSEIRGGLENADM